MVDDDDTRCNDNEVATEYMIALFYMYSSNPVPVKEHMEFQRRVGTELFLGGRIRVSVEGINGVLSGTRRHLQRYEQLLQNELIPTATLLTEPAERIASPATSEDSCAPPDSRSSSNINLNMKYCKLRPDLPCQEQLFDKLQVQETRHVVTMDNNTPIGTGNAISNLSALMDYERAPHLSPEEWHAQLVEKSIGTINRDNDQLEPDAILMDIRNVYESKVGYFDVMGIPTILTNTRNYSSLPRALEACIPHMAGKTIYMYCTGGVRCERASQYVQLLAASSPEWRDLPPPKQIYQLDGGIQKYLETFSLTSFTKEGTITVSPPIHKNCTNDQYTCLFRGKNFVFDPRRTDPMVGHNNFTIVGRCLVCDSTHDDYDNGFAPRTGREARCCRCRVLILVCTSCRQIYQCWGEEDQRHVKPKVFCGMKGLTCVDQGNLLESIQIINKREG
jgi:predicted sulfurtransferase